MAAPFSFTTPLASISNSRGDRQRPGFTLVEVVIALGVLAITVVAVVALQGALARMAGEISGQERAAQLVEPCVIELARLRDRPADAGQPARLDALAGLIPANDSSSALRLVASSDGLRVVVESEADDAVHGLAMRDRHFLIEVRQQPAPLNYASGSGFLALTLRIKWPYQVASGPATSDAVAADLDHASSLDFNCALTP